MKRSFDPSEPEWMDRPQPVSPELETDLRNLRRINRWFGSHTLIRIFLNQWLEPGRTYSILDLATGSGDIPRMIADWARRRQISIRIAAVDAQDSTLEIAKGLSASYPEITYLRGDARTFDGGQTYDLVCSSLALHHFSNDDAVMLLRHMRELSHDKVLVADLERTLYARLAVWLLTALLFREPMTNRMGGSRWSGHLISRNSRNWLPRRDGRISSIGDSLPAGRRSG